MYTSLLVVHVISAILICILVLVSQNKNGGTRDFTTDVYSSNSIMTKKYANSLTIKVLGGMGVIFMMSAMGLIFIDRHSTSKILKHSIAKELETPAAVSRDTINDKAVHKNAEKADTSKK